MKSTLRIVFYGTPEFAVPALDILLKNNFDVVAVVTAPDRPSGRGQKIVSSAVKDYAVEHQIPVLQPVKLKHESFLSELKSLQPDLQIVVAFRMLPEEVWKLPKKGTFNLHGSLLPQYRGAAPINWAIINGETETGVTTFFLRHEIDTGDILFQEKMTIAPDETAGELHDRMMKIGASLVLKTVQAIEDGTFRTTIQSGKQNSPVHAAPKLNKENTRLDNKKIFSDAHNFIRGLSPYPTAYCEFFNAESGVSLSLKIFKSVAHPIVHSKIPGTIETDNKSYLRVYFLKGYLDFLELQVAGRNKVVIKDFLNGFKFEGHWSLRG